MSSGYFGDILSETLSPSKKKHKHNARDSKSSRYTSSTKATLTFDAEDDTDDILRLRQTIQEKRRQNQEIMRKLEEENASVRDIKNKRHQQRDNMHSKRAVSSQRMPFDSKNKELVDYFSNHQGFNYNNHKANHSLNNSFSGGNGTFNRSMEGGGLSKHKHSLSTSSLHSQYKDQQWKEKAIETTMRLQQRHERAQVYLERTHKDKGQSLQRRGQMYEKEIKHMQDHKRKLEHERIVAAKKELDERIKKSSTVLSMKEKEMQRNTFQKQKRLHMQIQQAQHKKRQAYLEKQRTLALSYEHNNRHALKRLDGIHKNRDHEYKMRRQHLREKMSQSHQRKLSTEQEREHHFREGWKKKMADVDEKHQLARRRVLESVSRQAQEIQKALLLSRQRKQQLDRNESIAVAQRREIREKHARKRLTELTQTKEKAQQTFVHNNEKRIRNRYLRKELLDEAMYLDKINSFLHTRKTELGREKKHLHHQAELQKRGLLGKASNKYLDESTATNRLSKKPRPTTTLKYSSIHSRSAKAL